MYGQCDNALRADEISICCDLSPKVHVSTFDTILNRLQLTV